MLLLHSIIGLGTQPLSRQTLMKAMGGNLFQWNVATPIKATAFNASLDIFAQDYISVVHLLTAQETVFDVVVSRFTLRWHNVTVQEPRREYQPLCFIDRLDNLDIHNHGLYRFNMILRYQPLRIDSS